MENIIAALQGTPLPTLLVVGGIVFLFLAVVGEITGKFKLEDKQQKWSAIIGTLLLFSGIVLYVVPRPRHPLRQHLPHLRRPIRRRGHRLILPRRRPQQPPLLPLHPHP